MFDGVKGCVGQRKDKWNYWKRANFPAPEISENPLHPITKDGELFYTGVMNLETEMGSSKKRVGGPGTWGGACGGPPSSMPRPPHSQLEPVAGGGRRPAPLPERTSAASCLLSPGEEACPPVSDWRGHLHSGGQSPCGTRAPPGPGGPEAQLPARSRVGARASHQPVSSPLSEECRHSTDKWAISEGQALL